MAIELSYLNQQNKWNNENDIRNVVADLNNNENKVQILRLTGNSMGVTAAQALTAPLSKQKDINRLLWNDMFTGRLKDEIGLSLKALSLGLIRAQVNLVELDLSDNAFGPNGVIGVTSLIANQCCYSLKILNMNNLGLGHDGCRALTAAMKLSRTESNKCGLNLEEFIAGRNRLENVGMEMLSEVFGDGMNSLKKVVLLQNGIGIHGIDGIECLIVALKNHKNLRILNIADNHIKANGMNLLSAIMSEFENLEELYMDDCLLKKKGTEIFRAIAEDPCICPALKVISLLGNEMKSCVAVSLVTAIMDGKRAIEKIDLRENEINKNSLCEIKNIVKSYGKEDIFVDEDEVTDEEEEGDYYNDSSVTESFDDVSRDGTDSDNSTAAKNDNDKKQSYDSIEEFPKIDTLNLNFKDESSTNPSKSNIFSSSATVPSIFHNTALSTQIFNPNLFTTCTASKSSNPSESIQGGLFSVSSKASNIFATAPSPIKSTSPSTVPGGLFSNTAVPSSQSSLFSISIGHQNLFGTSLQSTAAFCPPSLSARTNLFSTSTLNSNIFSRDGGSSTQSVAPGPKLFSFAEAAKPNVFRMTLRENIIIGLKSDSLMAIDRLKLKMTMDSVSFDNELMLLAENCPDNAVRVGLILCEEKRTFGLGISLLTHLLTSANKWSHATNAMLVEMNCIKSEEKPFVPICNTNPALPIKVLQSIVAEQKLSEAVKNNFITVLRNLTKIRTLDSEDLLRQLNQSMNRLTI